MLKVDFEPTEELILSLFRRQAEENPVYKNYLKLLSIAPAEVRSRSEIPHLPIRFFKSQPVYLKSLAGQQQRIFKSSGTTGQQASCHYLFDEEFYRQNAQMLFEAHFGATEEFCHLALLPGYLERGNSSLVFMVQHFVKQSQDPDSGFFLDKLERLSQHLREKQRQGVPTVLWGVSFALLDLAEQHPQDLPAIRIIETGGMKGRRRELIRAELHHRLKQAFSVDHISSEYGMTELLSQAYAPADGLFKPPKQLLVGTRSITDPRAETPPGKTGALKLIDLANVESCAFIQTDDLGRIGNDGSFEVLGRNDHSEQRGCNLMVF